MERESKMKLKRKLIRIWRFAVLISRLRGPRSHDLHTLQLSLKSDLYLNVFMNKPLSLYECADPHCNVTTLHREKN